MSARLTAVDARRRLPMLAAGITSALVFAPWVLGFSASHAAVAGHIAFAMGIAPIAILIGSLAPAAVTTMIAGTWLAASPWALGYATRGLAAWSVDVCAGIALIGLGALALRLSDERPPDVAPARIERL
jgi:SPW repeat